MFLLGCIPTRIALSYLADAISDTTIMSKLVSVILLAISLGFAFIYIFGWRKTGMETQGAPIWWNNWRPFHAITYGLGAYLLWTKTELYGWSASDLIFWDAMVGLLVFTNHHR